LRIEKGRKMSWASVLFYSQQLGAVNRTDVLKYVRAALHTISTVQTKMP
jgi:hypothetical protein